MNATVLVGQNYSETLQYNLQSHSAARKFRFPLDAHKDNDKLKRGTHNTRQRLNHNTYPTRASCATADALSSTRESEHFKEILGNRPRVAILNDGARGIIRNTRFRGVIVMERYMKIRSVGESQIRNTYNSTQKQIVCKHSQGH